MEKNFEELNLIARCAYGVVKEVKMSETGEVTYLYERENDGLLFDIGNGWRGFIEGTYVAQKTCTRIIDIIRNKMKYATKESSEKLNTFLLWYDTLNTANNVNNMNVDGTTNNNDGFVSSSNNGQQVDSSVLLQMLSEMKKQTEVMASNERLDNVIEKKTQVIADKLKEIVDNYILKEYGNLPKKVEIQTPKAVNTVEGPIHRDFERILQLVNLKIPTLLVGPAGCGKNYILEKCAESLGLNFYFTNAITQEYKLTGFIDANGVYQETQFYKAFTQGGIFFLDELDASIPEAVIILNAAIANGYFDFPNGKVSAHPDFRVVAAANTMGLGADMLYVGRSQLDAATLDRFITFKIDYDEVLERTKCLDNELYSFIIELRRIVNKLNIRFTVSTRMMINSYKMLINGLDKQLILDTAILKSLTKDDISQIKSEFNINNEWTNLLRNCG